MLKWLIDPPKVGPGQDLPNLLGWSLDDIYGQRIEPQQADHTVRGLAGLVVLGNAWESVDIFHALNVALQCDSLGYARGREGGRNTMAYLAWLRCRELIDAGQGSMLPDAPKGEALEAMLPKPELVMAEALLDPAYKKLRIEADAWQAARTAFMMERLKAGRHPDTDPYFWDGYAERPAPGLPAASVPERYAAWMQTRQRIALIVVLGVPALLIALIVGLARRANRRDAREADDRRAESLDGSRFSSRKS